MFEGLLKIKHVDYSLLFVIIILSLFGLLMVYSASNVVASFKYNDSLYYFKRQFIFLVISYIILILLIMLDTVYLEKYANIIFIISFIFLLLVLVPFIGVKRGGARSWISVIGFSIQPSEVMKFGLILMYSKLLQNQYKNITSFKTFCLLFMIPVIIFLVIMLQPDFGTGIVIIASSLIILYICGGRYKHFTIIVVLLVAFLVVLIIIAPYRLKRIYSFLDPSLDPLGAGFQGIQSLYAITPGALFGHGFNNSIQKHFFLPEPQNDFIFAICLEEFGLIGGFIILGLFFFIIYKGYKISIYVSNKFDKFLAISISTFLAVQLIINVFVVVGLFPVTGITFPLFSYGGSSLIITMSMLAILLNISKKVD